MTLINRSQNKAFPKPDYANGLSKSDLIQLFYAAFPHKHETRLRDQIAETFDINPRLAAYWLSEKSERWPNENTVGTLYEMAEANILTVSDILDRLDTHFKTGKA